MSKSTYDFKDKSIIHSEKIRLTDMSQFAASFDLPALIEAGLQPEMRVFDLGCGTGTVDMIIADYCSEGSVIGMDINNDFLQEARGNLAKAESRNICYIQGEAEAIPLADNSVDLCYSRSLFQHLPNPEKAIDELYRITKPGGIVAIIDVDDAGLILHPEPEGFYDFLTQVQIKQKEQGGDRFIGRKLYSLLHKKFDTADYKALPLTSKSIGNKTFMNIVSGYKLRLMQNTDKVFKENLERWGNDSSNLGILFTFLVYAQK